ncbi:MAG: maleylpyruvate isomerase N-terminal domain-containing protein, partial [Actinomycetota bacterium]|nr:maleylpyruvate isomerase N-terminal domain-containing protein [Actinomycetota bacterium]
MRYDAADRPLSQILDAVPVNGWGNPSPCGKWSAADVVGHLIGTQREFLATHGVDLGEAPDVAADPVPPGAGTRSRSPRRFPTTPCPLGSSRASSDPRRSARRSSSSTSGTCWCTGGT